MKGRKLDKSKVVIKSVGIIDTIIFMYVSFSNQIASKTFATQCFFTDYLNHEIVNKTTCRTLSANPHQLWAH